MGNGSANELSRQSMGGIFTDLEKGFQGCVALTTVQVCRSMIEGFGW